MAGELEVSGREDIRSTGGGAQGQAWSVGNIDVNGEWDGVEAGNERRKDGHLQFSRSWGDGDRHRSGRLPGTAVPFGGERVCHLAGGLVGQVP